MEQDLGLQKLQISDPMAPPPPPKEYDSASLGSETVPVHTPPPGITIDGKMWQQDDTSDVSTPVSARPVSVRNLAVAPRNSTRPARFIKADQPLQHPGAAQIPAELQPVQRLYDLYRSKVYIEGYLFKKNETTGKRSIAEEHPWVKSYVELSGPVLTVWDAEIEEGDVTPQYINIADSVIELNEHGFIALRTAGSARYLFDAPDQDVRTRDRWVRALRLSCFEGTRIHEIYTKKFIMRHRVIEEDGEEQDLLATPKTKMEGYLQVRFSGVNEWQKYWVVVSDRRDEKKLFGKKSVPSRGQLMFYETKKAKQPIMTIVNVVQAYTLYPDSPQLVDLSTLIKVDGSIGTAASADQVEEAPTTTSLLMMTTNNTELVEWLIGVYDAFKLYGRPSQLLRDPTNTNSLSFGEIVTSPRLFLEVAELEGVNVQTETARQNNEAFVNIMLNKMRQHLNRAGVQGAAAAAPPPPASGMGPRTMSMPQIAGNQGGFRNPRSRTVSADQDPGNVPRASMMPQSMSMGRLSAFPSARGPMQPSGQRIQPSRNTMLAGGGKVVYNSDDSEEEDDDDAEEDSDDDDDSVFGHKTGAATSSSSTSALKKSSAVTGSSLNMSLPTTEQASQQTAIETEHPKIVVGEDEEEQTQRSQQQLTESSKDEGNKKKKKIQPTASDSEEESEEDQQDSEDDDDDQESTKYTPHRPRSRWPQQTPQNLRASAMPPPMGHPQGFADNEYPPEGFGTPQPYPYPAMVDEDGPIIPQLGENFANPHSLLGSVRPEHISAKEMAEHAKATGQPLVDIPYKPPEPRAGLVGMISQIEQNKKELSKGRMLEQEKERMMFERERERYLMEQRQSMMPPNMMGGMNMGMMDPRMTMMGPQLGMMNGNNGRPMMMPMMDPRMTMMMPMMDPRMSMMPPGMMGMGNNNNGNATSSGSHVPSMMMPMMDPRMSMMPPQMMMNPMMYGMFNPMMQQQQQQQQQRGPGGIPEEEDEDDEEDNLPLGQQQHQQQQNSRLSPSPIPSTSKSGNK